MEQEGLVGVLMAATPEMQREREVAMAGVLTFALELAECEHAGTHVVFVGHGMSATTRCAFCGATRERERGGGYRWSRPAGLAQLRIAIRRAQDAL